MKKIHFDLGLFNFPFHATFQKKLVNLKTKGIIWDQSKSFGSTFRILQAGEWIEGTHFFLLIKLKFKLHLQQIPLWESICTMFPKGSLEAISSAECLCHYLLSHSETAELPRLF